MKKTVKTTYTDEEFRALIRQELKTVLSGEDIQIGGPGNEGFISLTQAAEFLKLKPNTIYNLINKKGIPFHKKPGSNRVLFMKSELLEWLKASEKQK